VEYHGWYENDDSVFIAMEYMKHGDLGSYLTKPLPDNEAREITFQLAEGLEHMHKDGFVHRDFKPEVSLALVYPFSKVRTYQADLLEHIRRHERSPVVGENWRFRFQQANQG